MSKLKQPIKSPLGQNTFWIFPIAIVLIIVGLGLSLNNSGIPKAISTTQISLTSASIAVQSEPAYITPVFPAVDALDITSLAFDSLEQALERAKFGVTTNIQWQVFNYIFPNDPTSTEMLLVPTGSFTMGGADGHHQEIKEAFWIDKYEVTNVDFVLFLNLYGNQSDDSFDYIDNSEGNPISNTTAWVVTHGYEYHPVVYVTWFAARDYCMWRGGRLLTELEWEFSARGPNNWEYPWGNDWNPDNTVWNDNKPDATNTAFVGSRPSGASWVGALDMSGNVREWVSSLYAEYPYDISHENITNTLNYRVQRGGSWLVPNYLAINDFRAIFRGYWYPDVTYSDLGFRCARSLE